MSAPYARVASNFTRGAVAGITMVARHSNSEDASAIACAWLPEENVMTPLARCSAESRESAW